MPALVQRGFANSAGTAAQLNYPIGVAVVEFGGEVYVYVADYGNNCIRKIEYK